MRQAIEFILRVMLVAIIWFGLWKWMTPRNRLERVVRLILLVGGLLGILFLLRNKK